MRTSDKVLSMEPSVDLTYTGISHLKDSFPHVRQLLKVRLTRFLKKLFLLGRLEGKEKQVLQEKHGIPLGSLLPTSSYFQNLELLRERTQTIALLGLLKTVSQLQEIPFFHIKWHIHQQSWEENLGILGERTLLLQHPYFPCLSILSISYNYHMFCERKIKLQSILLRELSKREVGGH